MSALTIGGLRVEGQVFLAPMAGVTTSPFRLLARRFGASLVYSEMISANGVAYNNKKTKTIAHVVPSEHPVAIQIFGSDPKNMAVGARFVCEAGADIVDINMGCPQTVIVRGGNGAGVALMARPQRAREVIKAVVGASSVPVTVKMRSGWKSVNALEIAAAAQEEGAAAVTVHPRTGVQGFGGLADWNIIEQVKASVDVPVIGSGDLFGPGDGQRMMAQTGCDAIMYARGVKGAPWEIGRARALLEGRPVPSPPDLEERVVMLKGLARGMAEWQREAFTRFSVHESGYETRALCEMRKFVFWFLKGLPKWIVDRQRLYGVRTMDEFDAFLDSACADFEAKRGDGPRGAS